MEHKAIVRRLVEQQDEIRFILSGKIVKRHALEREKKALDSTLIKAVLGPRRAGKTIFSLLLVRGRDFGYVNFDDEVFYRISSDEVNDLYELIVETLGKHDILILDEIQNIEGWEFFITRLQRIKRNLIITGSNSKLLSSELATHLTGRTISIRVLPFSFYEYLQAINFKEKTMNLTYTERVGAIRHSLQKYIEEGGFPEVVLGFTEWFLKKRYLRDLWDAILIKDILMRYEIRNMADFIACANVVVNSYARRLSYRKLAKQFGISERTAKTYIHYLLEGYLLLESKKFSNKPRESELAFRKYYVIDTGLIHAKTVERSSNRGHLLENLVAVELYRRSFDLMYYLDENNHEVDFIIKNDGHVDEIIQVCYDMDSLPPREAANALAAAQKLNCNRITIITWLKDGSEIIDERKVLFIPFWKWVGGEEFLQHHNNQ